MCLCGKFDLGEYTRIRPKGSRNGSENHSCLTPKRAIIRSSRNKIIEGSGCIKVVECHDQDGWFTFPLSKRCVIMTMTLVFCSHTIRQKPANVPWIGPCVAMYALGFRKPSTKFAFMYSSFPLFKVSRLLPVTLDRSLTLVWSSKIEKNAFIKCPRNKTYFRFSSYYDHRGLASLRRPPVL